MLRALRGKLLRPTATSLISMNKTRMLNTYSSLLKDNNELNPESILKKLQDELGAEGCLTSVADKSGYITGKRGEKGDALAVLLPKNASELSAILKICNDENIGMVTQSGNTGLVGGSIPYSQQELLISMQNFNRGSIEVNKTNATATVSASYKVTDINDKAKTHGLRVPLQFGGMYDALAGGIVATNPAGISSMRYGSAGNMITTFKVMTADGLEKPVMVKDVGKKSKKGAVWQNNGDMGDGDFIGSLGFLGIVTEITFSLSPIPEQLNEMLLFPTDRLQVTNIREAVLKKLHEIVKREAIQKKDSKMLAAFEGMSIGLLRGASKQSDNAKGSKTAEWSADNSKMNHILKNCDSIIEDEDYALLLNFESHELDSQGLRDVMLEVYEDLYNKEFVKDAVMGNEDGAMMAIRENISLHLKTLGDVLPFDVAIADRDKMQEFIKDTIEVINRVIKEKSSDTVVYPSNFGHIFEGAVHFNLVFPNRDLSPELKKSLQTAVYEHVSDKYKGTISAEHGIGPLNVESYAKHTSFESQARVVKAKHELDPKCIFNRAVWLNLEEAQKKVFGNQIGLSIPDIESDGR